MLITNKFYFSIHFLFNNYLLNKFFSKNIYSKFLISTKYYRKKRIHFFEVDNFSEFFTVKLKKKYKRLGLSSRLKLGFFLKANLFIYRHSKLSFYRFVGIKFKPYVKKNLYLNIKSIKNNLDNLGLLFIYRSVRGGFLCFSNKISGFLPGKHFCVLKKNVLFYKKYFILNKSSCVSFFNSNFPMFLLYTAGFLRNYSKLKKKSLRRLIFKRFKFIFSFKFFFFKKYIKYFRNFLSFFLFYNLKIFTRIFFLKLFFLLK